MDKKLHKIDENINKKTNDITSQFHKDVYETIGFKHGRVFKNASSLENIPEYLSKGWKIGGINTKLRSILIELVWNIMKYWIFDENKHAEIAWKRDHNIVYLKTSNFLDASFSHDWIIKSLGDYVSFLETINNEDQTVLLDLHTKNLSERGHNQKWGGGAWTLRLWQSIKSIDPNIWRVFEYKFSSIDEWNFFKFELITKVPLKKK